MAPVETGARPSALSLWGPVAACMALVFVFSSMSSPPAPPQVNDKVEHFLFYGFLAVVTLRATAGGRLAGVTPAAARAAGAVAAAERAPDEQPPWFVPGPTAQVADWLADTLGAATAAALATQGAILLRSRRASRALNVR